MRIFRIARFLDEALWRALRKILDGQTKEDAIIIIAGEMQLQHEEASRLKYLVDQMLTYKPKLSYADLPRAYQPTKSKTPKPPKPTKTPQTTKPPEIQNSQTTQEVRNHPAFKLAKTQIKQVKLAYGFPEPKIEGWLEIGSAPPEENCAQVGRPNYAQEAKIECQKYIEAIRQKLGPEPQGSMLGVRSNHHDFGTYFEVVCYYTSKEGLDYALACEGYGPTTWDDITPVPLKDIIAKIEERRRIRKEEEAEDQGLSERPPADEENTQAFNLKKYKRGN